MELRHLRYFAATADAGTVSAAAAALHVTQPGLSRQLRQLEHELGVALFDRSGGRLRLSASGRALLPLARDLLDRAEAFRLAAALHAAGRLERVTVAAPTVTLTDVVAPFLATLSPEDPTADVVGSDDVTPVEALARGADLALGTARPGPPYRSRPLAVLPVWAQVPADHPWAGRDALTLAELSSAPLVVLPSTFTSRQALDTALAQQGTSAERLLEAPTGAVAQALASAGRGVAVVSDDPRHGLVALPVDLDEGARLSIRLVTVWDERHPGADTLESIARRLSAFVCDRYDVPPH